MIDIFHIDKYRVIKTTEQPTNTQLIEMQEFLEESNWLAVIVNSSHTAPFPLSY